MKKIVSAICAATMAGAMFAEVNVGAWGRSGANFGVLSTKRTEVTESVDKDTGKKTYKNAVDPTDEKSEQDGSTETKIGAYEATPGWAGGSRVGVNFGAASEDGNIGFNLNLDSNASSAGIGDQAKIWANLGFVKVQFGRIQLDDLRGSIGDNGNRTEIAVAGEDAIFARFNPGLGMTVSATPVDGLFIGAAIDAGEKDLKDTFKKAQVGVGYTIADVAQIKAQYIGGIANKLEKDLKGSKKTGEYSYDSFIAQKGAKAGDGNTYEDTTYGTALAKDAALTEGKVYYTKNEIEDTWTYGKETIAEGSYYGKAQLGVDILCLPVLVEVGVTVPLSTKTVTAVDADGNNVILSQQEVDTTIGFSGAFDAFSFKGHVIVNAIDNNAVTGEKKAANCIVAGCDLQAEIALGAFDLGLNCGYKYAPSIVDVKKSLTDINIDQTIAGEIYAKKGFGNGYIFAGVADTLVLTKDTSLNKNVVTNSLKIPVGAEYWF